MTYQLGGLQLQGTWVMHLSLRLLWPNQPADVAEWINDGTSTYDANGSFTATYDDGCVETGNYQTSAAAFTGTDPNPTLQYQAGLKGDGTGLYPYFVSDLDFDIPSSGGCPEQPGDPPAPDPPYAETAFGPTPCLDPSSSATVINPGAHEGFQFQGSATVTDTDDTRSCSISGSLAAVGPTAVPGNYTVVRTHGVTLDASKSTPGPGAVLTKYKWTFTPLADKGCAQTHAFTVTTATSARPRYGPFSVLCTFKVTLTVTDSKGRTDTASGHVTVEPRKGEFSRTPFSHRADNQGSHTQYVPDGQGQTHYFGRNVADCAQVRDPDVNYCPLHIKDGYQPGQVHDRIKGPFQGYYYVETARFYSSLLGIINKELTPVDAPPEGSRQNMYEYNMAHNAGQFAAFVTAVEEHENMGAPGRPTTGHSGLMSLYLKTERGNLNQRVEAVSVPPAAGEDGLFHDVHSVISDAETGSEHATSDRVIGTIGTYRVFTWVADLHGIGHWEAFTVTVGPYGI